MACITSAGTPAKSLPATAYIPYLVINACISDGSVMASAIASCLLPLRPLAGALATKLILIAFSLWIGPFVPIIRCSALSSATSDAIPSPSFLQS